MLSVTKSCVNTREFWKKPEKLRLERSNSKVSPDPCEDVKIPSKPLRHGNWDRRVQHLGVSARSSNKHLDQRANRRNLLGVSAQRPPHSRHQGHSHKGKQSHDQHHHSSSVRWPNLSEVPQRNRKRCHDQPPHNSSSGSIQSLKRCNNNLSNSAQHLCSSSSNNSGRFLHQRFRSSSESLGDNSGFKQLLNDQRLHRSTTQQHLCSSSNHNSGRFRSSEPLGDNSGFKQLPNEQRLRRSTTQQHLSNSSNSVGPRAPNARLLLLPAKRLLEDASRP